MKLNNSTILALKHVIPLDESLLIRAREEICTSASLAAKHTVARVTTGPAKKPKRWKHRARLVSLG
jgi:hypothetical protein